MTFSSLCKKPAFYFLLALLVLWLPLVWGITSPFVTSILLGLVLSVVVYPIYSRISRSVRPGVASGLTTLATVVAVIVLLTFLGIVLGGEVTEGYRILDQKSSAEGGWSAFADHTLDRSIEFVASKTNMSPDDLRTQLNDGLRRLATALLAITRSIVAGITSGVVNFVFASIFMYFFLRNGPEWVEKIVQIVPLEPRATLHLLNTLKDSIIANVNGVLVVAVAQSVLLFIGLFFAGIKGALLWSLIGGMASVIPVVGGTIIWVPCVAWLLIQSQWLPAILLAAWCAVVVGSADNVIRPLVVGGRVQQHPVLIAIAMLGGAQAFGAAGVLIGPVVLAFFFALIKELNMLAQPKPMVEVVGEDAELSALDPQAQASGPES